MNDADLNAAIVAAVGHTAVPHVDTASLVSALGEEQGAMMAAALPELVREANSMPIDWGDKSLAQGVNDIMTRFRKLHPGLSVEALREIWQCVGWNWR